MLSSITLTQMEKRTRSPAEFSGGEKGYHNRPDERGEAPKEEQESSHSDEPAEPESATGTSKPVQSPTDCVLKIKSSDTDTAHNLRRNCSPGDTDSAASSSRPPPLSPQYRHILPEPSQSWSHRNNGYEHHQPPFYRPEHAQAWHQHPDDPHHHYPPAEHEPHANVRLPSIATLLTEPYNPQPMPRMAGYSERADWVPGPPMPPPERYPPIVAALPLDDSRARTPQPMPQRKRGRLPKETTDFLKAWLHSHSAHPYPSEIEKKQMCHATGLSMSQVSNWMINGRRRILGPSYLSTSRSTPHGSPPVTLSSPQVTLSSPSVMLTSPSLMLRSPTSGPPS
ncbi:hypothetical protein B0H11DRAFT_1897973 [Mycena galericulata]|nr:hypothetical protein B0H11DRAFT_1897973 [Mycena galericulata]